MPRPSTNDNGWERFLQLAAKEVIHCDVESVLPDKRQMNNLETFVHQPASAAG